MNKKTEKYDKMITALLCLGILLSAANLIHSLRSK